MTTDKLETGGPAYPAQPVVRLPHGAETTIEQGGMSLRTYAAIKLRVPQSGHEFINDMIRERQRFELAKAAMTGIEASQGNNGSFVDGEENVASIAYKLADAMLAEQEKK